MSSSKYEIYFKREEGLLKCLECEKNGKEKVFAARPGYGTTHLRRHLLNIHEILVDVNRNCGPLADSVVNLVIEQAIPFSVIQSNNFHSTIQKAREFPEEAIPSTTTIAECVHKKYLDELEQLKKELRKSMYASIVIDHWTSKDIILQKI